MTRKLLMTVAIIAIALTPPSALVRLCRFVVIEDFGTDVGSDEFDDWRSLRGGERTQE